MIAMPEELLRFAVSLGAVALIVALVHCLHFARYQAALSEAEARQLLALALGGFEPEQLTIAPSGHAALARDENGRTMVLRRHGAQFVAEALLASTRIERAGDTLVIEQPTGKTRLELGKEATGWARLLGAR